jgi:iron(III) transport system substrate-binding protein
MNSKQTMAKALVTLLAALTLTTASADGVLVFGGTGQLGAYHVQQLAEQGMTVAVFHRATSKFNRLQGAAYESIEGNLLDAASVLAAMEKIRPRIVIDTSARRGGVADRDPFYATAMRNIVDAAVATDVKHIIIHSSIGVRGSAAPLMKNFGYDTGSANMRDKAAAEVILEESGIPYTIIRNGLLDFEPVAATGNARLTDDEAAFSRITRADLARLALNCIDDTDCTGKVFHAVDDTLTGQRPRPATTLSVYASLNPPHLEPVIAAFEADTGIKVNVEHMTANELLERLIKEQNGPSADVVFTMDAMRLAKLTAADVLTPVASERLTTAIPSHFRHPEGLWFGLSKWSRSVYYAKDRVNPAHLPASYAALAEDRWKGRICVRPANKIYVQTLLASLIANDGEQAARRFVRGIVKNLARTPVDLDIEQIRAVGAGKCDLAIANSYYYGRLLGFRYNPLSATAGAEVGRILDNVVPLAVEQKGRGVHMNISAFALTRMSQQPQRAIQLMEYLVQPLAQRLYADAAKDFPIIAGLRSNEADLVFGEFHEDASPIADLARHYQQAEKLSREEGWLWK